jgi:hypothetical protein
MQQVLDKAEEIHRDNQRRKREREELEMTAEFTASVIARVPQLHADPVKGHPLQPA